MPASEYEPIGDYAIVGNCRSAALVSRSGSVDWLCLPDFSSPSLFAALLDRRHGGRFVIRPRAVASVERRYLADTAVLETRFNCASGVLRLVDFMPMKNKPGAQRLMRLVECEDGEVSLDIVYQPRPDYGCVTPDYERVGENGWESGQGTARLRIESDLPLGVLEAGTLGVQAYPLRAGQRDAISLHSGDVFGPPVSMENCLGETVDWWREWCGQCNARGPYAEEIKRSCLTLKLLTNQGSGGVVAALTTSLPESMTAGRNWDYRFCWLRDTSLLLQSFIDMGFTREADAFLRWLLRVSRSPSLSPLYDVDGGPVQEERVVSTLEGYRGRGPVRVGNSACRQLQLDIYGEVIHTAYLFTGRGGVLDDAEKGLLVSLGDAVMRLWREPDQSIWEVRGEPRHHTYSKLMCWVAMDRLMEMAASLRLSLDVAALARERAAIREVIETQGFDNEAGGYVGYFGGHEADASLLFLARYGYIAARDERMLGTYRLIRRQLAHGHFLYRYPQGQGYDRVEGRENLFAACSFWEVSYLARAGEIDKAVELFERLLTLANDVGLYAEQFETGSGAPLGNFPQAFSHSGLISAALAIEQAREGKRDDEID